jgi:hypothetical protein
MREYHLHPDGQFIIRENSSNIAELEASEISQFAELSLPQGCSEVLVASDGIVYVTINKSQEGSPVNYLSTLIEQEDDIIAFYEAKLAAIEAANEPEPEIEQ